MKTTLTKNLLLLFVATVLLSACKDDDPGDGTIIDDNYFTGNAGSVWVYDNSSISTEGTTTPLTTKDTLTVAKDTVLLGNSAKWITHKFLYPFGAEISNTALYGMKQDGSQLSVSSNFMSLLIPDLLKQFIPVTANTWMLIANANAGTGSSWIIDSTHITEQTIEGMPLGIKFTSGDVKMVIQRQADTTFAGKPSHQYKLSVSYTGGASSTDQMTQALIAAAGTVKLTFAEINFFLASNAGLLGITAQPYSPIVTADSFSSLSLPLDFLRTPGFTKILSHSDIK